MKSNEIKGIIVSYQVYREYDAILHVLGECGNLFSLIARGVQKVNSKMSGCTQLFTYGIFRMKDASKTTLQALTGVELLDGFTNIRVDLLKQACASYICEVSNLQHPQEHIFPIVYECLKALNQNMDAFTVLSLFQSCMNSKHGIKPFVDGCVICGREQGICDISLADGGFVCDRCKPNAKSYSLPQLRRFRHICKAELKHLELLSQQEVYCFEDFQILYFFFYEYVGVSIKSYAFLKHLVQMSEN